MKNSLALPIPSLLYLPIVSFESPIAVHGSPL